MKKSTLLLMLIFVFFVTANAQTSTFDKGNGVANFSIGIGNALYVGSGYKSSVPPLSVSYEVGIKDGIFDKGVLGVGGYLGYASSKYTNGYFGSDFEWKYTNLIIGVRGVLHYPLVDNLDTYAGLMLAYDYVSVSTPSGYGGTGYSTLGSKIILPGFIGARYYFNEKFAGLAELGWGIAYLNLGLAVKLK